MEGLTDRDVAEFLQTSNPYFGLLIEFFKDRQNQYRDEMPGASADGFPLVKAKWTALEELTKENGDRLRQDVRDYWQKTKGED